ncbi:MAG: hypothetical protein ABFE07_13095 [Armatimonadia bacterium]
MTCTSAKRLVRRIVLGQASAEEAAQFTAHQAECASCSAHWQRWPALLTRIEQSAPAAVTTHRDLVAAALPTASAPRTRAFGFRPLRLAAAVSLVLLLSLGGLTVCHKGGHGQDTPEQLLSVVEAAMVARRTHEVGAMYGSKGEVILRFESWHSPDGDTYTRQLLSDKELLRINGARGPMYFSQWRRPQHNLIWIYHPVKRICYVGWEWWGELHGPMPGSENAGDPIDIIRWWRNNFGKLIVTERTAVLDGQQVKVVRIVGANGPTLWTIDSYLSPDGSRLLRQTTVLKGPRGHVTHDTYRIDYDTAPPASLFEKTLPAGTKFTFEDRQIDPVWETMPEAEKQRVTDVIEGVAETWRKGDFAGFARYYDFAAGLQYGVKGRWTADELRTLWRRLVEQQPTRWRENDLLLDYVVGTSAPPAMALDFWSIYTKQTSGKTYHVYRDKPSTEPGLLVLTRERVTDQKGKTRELRTRLFMKKIGGQYKVILWRPPFAPGSKIGYNQAAQDAQLSSGG